MYYTFIDHVIEELDSRFNNNRKSIIAAQELVPNQLVQLYDDANDNGSLRQISDHARD